MARNRQQGLSLVEVLVAQVLVGLGLLGAAGLQLRSVQGTDSARMLGQAVFVAHGMLERARSARGTDGRDQLEFQQQIEALAGASGRGVLLGSGVQVSWDDERGGSGPRTIELGALR